MSLIEMRGHRYDLSQSQRWSHYLTLLFAVAAFLIGVNLRDSTLFATTLYLNSQAGIQAAYPKDWLLDTQGDYVFRVRDSSASRFKTTIQVAIRPVSTDTTHERNMLDTLSLSRFEFLSTYNVWSVEPFTLPNDVLATSMTYTYVDTGKDPFLENVPVVVQGRDILTIQRGQVVIISFLSELQSYDQNLPIFERFINSLKF
jgi:hypothetical protein